VLENSIQMTGNVDSQEEGGGHQQVTTVLRAKHGQAVGLLPEMLAYHHRCWPITINVGLLPYICVSLSPKMLA
jgi:hypothetical protein